MTYKNLPSIHSLFEDLIIVGNFDQIDGCVHWSSNLPGQKYAQQFVFAPGREIPSFAFSEEGDFCLASKTGTSMATPAVAAICALLVKYFPEKTIAEIKNALLKSTTKIHSIDNSGIFGQGLINVRCALESLDNPEILCNERGSLTQFIENYLPQTPSQNMVSIVEGCLTQQFETSLELRVYLINQVYEFVNLTNN